MPNEEPQLEGTLLPGEGLGQGTGEASTALRKCRVLVALCTETQAYRKQDRFELRQWACLTEQCDHLLQTVQKHLWQGQKKRCFLIPQPQ